MSPNHRAAVVERDRLLLPLFFTAVVFKHSSGPTHIKN
uniref:Uncharacterized protein n=1 Tax=Anguilla anguilla TaxID=7936 RepID=A0A0E9WKV4_ANGAN